MYGHTFRETLSAEAINVGNGGLKFPIEGSDADRARVIGAARDRGRTHAWVHRVGVALHGARVTWVHRVGIALHRARVTWLHRVGIALHQARATWVHRVGIALHQTRVAWLHRVGIARN